MPNWLITGGSSGLGLEVAKAALARGDNVTVTTRDATKLKDLRDQGTHTISLDIGGAESEIIKAVEEVAKKYGTIDILLNNAGYVLEGGIEEISLALTSSGDAEAKESFNLNVFAHLSVIRAVLPYMRKQKSGVIANMGSIAGWDGYINSGIYSAAKFALAGISKSLREEVKSFGVQVVIIDPGYFRTNFLSAGHKISAKKVIEEMKPIIGPLKEMLTAYDCKQPGDPVKGGKLIVDALTFSGPFAGKILPPRFAMGSDATAFIAGVLEKEKKSLDEWKEVSETTDIVE